MIYGSLRKKGLRRTKKSAHHCSCSHETVPGYCGGVKREQVRREIVQFVGLSLPIHQVHSVVGLLQDEVDPMVSVMKVEKAPLESYADNGGLDAQIQEIKEAVELPLTIQNCMKILVSSLSRGRYYTENHERAGPYLQRYDAHSGGEREIQRTMLELLNELDGFDSGGDVKVILEINKIESLDPALLQPDRIDRKIEFPLPDIKTRMRIFTTHTSRMTLADDVNLEEFFMTKEEFSGANIKAKCTEAGLFALRERHMKVMHADIKKAKDKIMFKNKEEVPKGLHM